MKRFVLIVIFFSLLVGLYSCEETQEENEANTQLEDTTTRYGSNLAALPPLSDAAKVQAVSWSVFEDFGANTARLKGNTLPALQNIAEQLTQQTDSLLIKIPDTLNTRPIYARLVITNTRAKLLSQVIQEGKVDSIQLEESLREMNKAAQNLFIEMNRTFTKGKIDDELKETEKKELEKQKKFLDSVYKAEIKDNNEN
ncbi:MAG: hypothetical protein CMC70_10975 [Flavobacteriaceae bacterium]|nr:hypothetical protein [Flavobacteriaceae bacterium]